MEKQTQTQTHTQNMHIIYGNTKLHIHFKRNSELKSSIISNRSLECCFIN